MAQKGSPRKLSADWVGQTRDYFLHFLHETRFPPIERHGERGRKFDYPEWLIMLIGVVAVKCHETTYLGIHRLACHYWQELCGPELKLPPISESQLRERLKKIGVYPGTAPGYVLQIFPPAYLE